MFSRVGKKVEDLDTPALLLDLDKFEKNLKNLPESLLALNSAVKVRPHCKAHKCPTIAHKQITHGAIGVCCQKLLEAESMVVGGIKDILISNEVVGVSKLHRQERCGVEPGQPAVALAKEIMALPNLVFKGIQTYQGWNQHVRKYDDRKAAVDKVIEKTKMTLEAFSANNIQCQVVTGGGTGTYPFEAASGVFTEVQPGSYIFMDADYGRNYDKDGQPFGTFEQSLYVLSTVISVTSGKRAILDAGMKAVSLDSGPPLVKDNAELVFSNGGDEHGILRPSGNLKVGDQVWLVPGHCDPTVNMYDEIIGVRTGLVESVWPITGRGPGV